ncbi:MAG: hypothetical protein ABJA67_15005 [Chthonomonadales bacterium]
MISDELTEVKYQSRSIWIMVSFAFAEFWVFFGLNRFVIGLFSEAPSSVLAALAAIGQVTAISALSLEDMLGAIMTRIGVKSKNSN